MRKIYSLVLIAAALLIGTNAWAQNTISLKYYGGAKADKTFPTLQEAIDYVDPGDSATITLLEEQNLTASIVIPNAVGESAQTFAARGKVVGRDPQRICLNLNGNDIVGDGALNQCCIALLKGVLHITGEGEINKRGNDKGSFSGWTRAAIAVSGAPGNKNDDTKDFSKDGWWSTLIIDENVKVTAPDNFKSVGLAIMDIGGYIGNKFYSNQNTPAFIGVRQQSTTKNPTTDADDKLGYSCYNAFNALTNATVPTANDIMWSRANSITYKEDGVTVKTNTDLQSCSFGVRVVVKGDIYGMNRGIFVFGPINQHPESFPTEGAHKETRTRYTIGNEHPYYYEHYFPWITIEKTAKVHCKASGTKDEEAGGIYAAGWAVFDISGEVYGQNGLYIKGGDIKLNDANVYSQDPHFGDDGWRNGEVAGNGIFITTDEGYAGDMSVEVNGDSRIAGNGGAAIVEVVASTETTPDVNNVTINGGTIEGGSTGAILVTEPTGDKTVAYGGTSITGATKKGGTESSVAATGTYKTEVTDPVTNKTTVVISDLGAGNSVVTVTENLTGTEEDYVKWTGTADQYILEDMTLEYLEMNPSPAVAQKIYVGDATHQATLTVDRVVMGSLAQIIVAPGSKFIVTGTQGIVAPKTENIILQHNSNTNQYATFLFNPSVESNKHPNATVTFTTNSWWVDNSNLQWEWFGIPTYNTAKSITSKAGDDAIYATVEVFENNDWTDLGYIGGTYDNNPAVLAKLNQPFAAYNLLAYRAYGATAPEITISGELVGNVNAPLNANKRWNPFANSYTAEVDAQAFVSALSSSENIADAIYVATQNNNGTITWNVRADEQLTGLKLKPMQAFLLNNSRYVEETAINYASMVYGPATANHAPRRFATADNSAKVTINVANENGTWDDVDLRENENVKAYEKYLNSDINIYVVDGEKNDYIVAEDLENTYVGFSTVKGGEFTISFANVEGREFDMIDLETGVKVAVNEGETYKFRADANTVADYRFKLVERAKLPTAIENTEAVKSVKGIYTITGQYLGEMNVWNALPAGVYVVNGEKRVK